MAGDFELVGRQFEANLIHDAGLRVASRVLDVGSGCGRLAIRAHGKSLAPRGGISVLRRLSPLGAVVPAKNHTAISPLPLYPL